MQYRAFQYKLAATLDQEHLFRHFAGTCRAVYNVALEQRRHHWQAYRRQHGKGISYPSQAHFACSHCGHRTNADVNAALNILKRNTASEHGVAGHGGLSFVPREVSTEQAHQGLEILGL